jgi:hypothetical protein
MAGEAWRSNLPKEKSESDLRNERWKAEAGSDLAGWFLFFVVVGLAVGIIAAAVVR